MGRGDGLQALGPHGEDVMGLQRQQFRRRIPQHFGRLMIRLKHAPSAWLNDKDGLAHVFHQGGVEVTGLP